MYIIIFLILLLAEILYIAPVKVLAIVDSEDMSIRLFSSWGPFFKASATIDENRLDRLQTSVKILGIHTKTRTNKKLVKKTLHNYRDILRAMSLSNTDAITSYGLYKPHLTGILYGAVCVLSSLLGVRALTQFPEFVPANEYIRMRVSTNLNLGKTIENLIRIKRIRRKKHGSSKSNSKRGYFVPQP